MHITGSILVLSGNTSMMTGGPSNNGQMRSLASIGIEMHCPYDPKGVSGVNKSHTIWSNVPPFVSASFAACGGILSKVAVSHMPFTTKAKSVASHIVPSGLVWSGFLAPFSNNQNQDRFTIL